MGSSRSIKQVVNNGNGFTIVEVLIAIGILSIGILGMATMQITSMRGNNTAGKLTSNSIWAINRIEQIMALDYDDAEITGSVYDHDTDTSLSAHLAANVGVGLHQNPVGSDGLDNNRDGQIDEAGETGAMSMQWQVVDDYPILDSKWIEITVSQGTGLAQKTVSIIHYKINTI